MPKSAIFTRVRGSRAGGSPGLMCSVPFTLGMRGTGGRRKYGMILKGLGRGEAAGTDRLAEVAPSTYSHRQMAESHGLAVVEDADDARVVRVRPGVRASRLKRSHERRIATEFARQQLQGDVPALPGVIDAIPCRRTQGRLAPPRPGSSRHLGRVGG